MFRLFTRMSLLLNGTNFALHWNKKNERKGQRQAFSMVSMRRYLYIFI